jgi:hypothetical protein
VGEIKKVEVIPMFSSKELEKKNQALELELKTVREKLLQYEEESDANLAIKSLNCPGPSQPILLIKIGDKGRGWIPGGENTKFLVEQIKAHKLDQQYNVLFFNYAIEAIVIKS